MPTHFLESILAAKRLEIEAAKRQLPQAVLEAVCRQPRVRRPFPGKSPASKGSGIHIIAEVKRASPSKGAIRMDLDPVRYARTCESAGASAMSVLTEPTFFKGSLEDARSVRSAVSIPVLRKDFILSPYQVYETRAAGLDALLLIVRILDAALFSELLALCRELDIDALVEVTSETEIDAALKAGATIIGINARDLATFNTDITRCARLRPIIGSEATAIALSGIRNRQDIEYLANAGFRHFLIGETLCRSPHPEVVLEELLKDDGLARSRLICSDGS